MRFRGDRPNSWCVGVAEWTSWQRWTTVRFLVSLLSLRNIFSLLDFFHETRLPHDRHAPVSHLLHLHEPAAIFVFSCSNLNIFLSCYLIHFYFSLYFFTKIYFAFAINARIIDRIFMLWTKNYEIFPFYLFNKWKLVSNLHLIYKSLFSIADLVYIFEFKVK